VRDDGDNRDMGRAVYPNLSLAVNYLTTVKQMNRWLCQPAVIPIAAIRGETRHSIRRN